jgi:hypothetical protein
MIKWIIAIASVIVCSIICFIIFPVELRPILLVTTLVLCILLLLLSFLPHDADYFKNIILASGIAATIVSWFIIGYINNENEKKRNLLEFERSTNQSKRDLKVRFLIDAYFRLENSDFRDTFPNGVERNMYDQVYLKYAESALTSVQLLGSDSTIRLANLYILSGGKDHFRELLESLRNELRKELALKALPNLKEYIPSVYRSYRKLGAPNKLTPEQEFQITLKLSEFERDLLK